MKQIRKRLTYANVMSSIAVFLVLGGATAFAASKIGASQLKANSVKTGKIVKEAVTTSKLKNRAVTTTKIADKAITGAKLDIATVGTVPSATNAGTAANLTGLYYAVVNTNGTLARGSAGVTSDILGGDTYRVYLPGGVNTKNCFFVATLGGNSPGNGVPGEVSVNPSGTPNAVYVSTYNSAGAGAPKEFSVLARC